MSGILAHGPPGEPLANDIAVDMDGTLFRTDTLVEGFFRLLFRDPRRAFLAVLELRKGRQALKAAVRDYSIQGVSTYPVCDELVAWLTAERLTGRRLHLVTAADRGVAHAAARRIDIFDQVIATDATVNLKGVHKRDALISQFADGWSYVGDSRADMPVFMGARSVGLAGHNDDLQSRVVRTGKHVEVAFPRAEPTLQEWMRLLRMHQWAKNILLFVPLILSGAFFDPVATLSVLAAFLFMGLCASGTYILNDLADLDFDRAHATKSARPLASGRIPLISAFLMATGLIVCSIGLACILSPRLGFLLAIYTVTTISYSMAFKRVAMFDVSILASLFTLRLAIGAVAASVALSGWLAAFSLTFFLSLSLAKRTTEICKFEKAVGNVPGRGYQKADLPLVLAFGVSAGMVALLLMILFLVFQAFQQTTYAEPRFLLVTPLMTFLWLSRVWLLATRGELKDDPVIFAVKDRISLGLGVLMFSATIAAVVGPAL